MSLSAARRAFLGAAVRVGHDTWKAVVLATSIRVAD